MKEELDFEEIRKERSKYYNQRKKNRKDYARYLTYKRQSELEKKKQPQTTEEFIKKNIKINNLKEAIRGEI